MDAAKYNACRSRRSSSLRELSTNRFLVEQTLAPAKTRISRCQAKFLTVQFRSHLIRSGPI
jgi:hypothetical protein